MTEMLRTWVLGMAGSAIFCALCGELTAGGRVKTVSKFLCGMVLTLALISPLTGGSFDGYALNMAKYRSRAEEISAEAAECSDSLSRTFIAGKCEAYIWDKAVSLGAEISGCSVSLRWNGEGFWYPAGVKIQGEYNEQLAEKIEEELGISRAGQEWYHGDDRP